VSVLLISVAGTDFSGAEIDAIKSFVLNGGGLFVQGLGWSWLGYHPGSTLDDYPMNKVTAPYGIQWIDGNLHHTFHTTQDLPDLCVVPEYISLGPGSQNCIELHEEGFKYNINSNIFNNGDVAATNVVISYFEGDPNNEENLMGSQHLSGILPGMAIYRDPVRFSINPEEIDNNVYERDFYVTVNCSEIDLNPSDNQAKIHEKIIIKYLDWIPCCYSQYEHGGKDACGQVASACVLSYWNSHNYDNFIGDDNNIDPLIKDLKKAQRYSDGSGTRPYFLDCGLKKVCNDDDYGNCYQFDIYGALFTSHSWSDMVSKINNLRPCIQYITSDTEKGKGHFFPIFGYINQSSPAEDGSSKWAIICDISADNCRRCKKWEDGDSLTRVIPGKRDSQNLEFSTEFVVMCPVDMSIVDPSGCVINKIKCEIDNATYDEIDVNGDDNLDDLVTLHDGRSGKYKIYVIPELEDRLTSNYTLVVSTNYSSIILAKNAPIRHINNIPYVIEIDNCGRIQIPREYEKPNNFGYIYQAHQFALSIGNGTATNTINMDSDQSQIQEGNNTDEIGIEDQLAQSIGSARSANLVRIASKQSGP